MAETRNCLNADVKTGNPEKQKRKDNCAELVFTKNTAGSEQTVLTIVGGIAPEIAIAYSRKKCLDRNAKNTMYNIHLTARRLIIEYMLDGRCLIKKSFRNKLLTKDDF